MKKSFENGRLSVAGSTRIRKTGSFGADGRKKSGIPTFKKGANFGTTAPPRPSLLGMNKSCGKLSTGSNFGLGRASISTVDSRRESRPIFDKNFQQKCQHQLIQFLEDNDYPDPISAKTLQSPSNKDFAHIFRFLYSFVNSNYKYPGDLKVLEDIPRLFKELRYPIPIQKSQVMCVASPSSWPQLLAGLDWLLNVVLQVINIKNNPIVDEIEEFYSQFHYKSYAIFLSGGDDYTENYDELRAQMQGDLCTDVDQLEAEHLALEKQISLLEKQQDPIPDLDQQIEMVSGDIKKFDDYLEELKMRMESKQQLTAEHKAAIEEEEKKMKFFNDDKEEKKEIVKVQEIKFPKFEEMRKENADLVKRKLKLETELKEIIELNGFGEIEIGKSFDEMESLCKKFNNLCRSVRLIPITEPFAQDRDFELRFHFGTDLSTRVDEIKIMINEKVKQIRDVNHDLTKHLIDEDNYVMRLSDLNTEGEQEFEKFSMEISVLDKEIQDCKQANATHLQQADAEIKNLNEELRGLAKCNSQFELAEIQRKNVELTKKLAKVGSEVAKDMETTDRLYARTLKMHKDFNEFMIKKVLCKHVKSARKTKMAFS